MAPFPAAAQTPVPFDLGEIVVSANLTPTAANRVGATVDVVTAQDLQQSPQDSVAQALAFEPGVTIAPKGSVGNQTSFSIRGAGQNYIGVVVDGIDVTDPSNTQVAFDFGHLGAGGISRIEILKGSQSALYGSSAIGGVVDITTARATEPGVHHRLVLEAGTYGTLNATYGFTAKTAASDFALTYSHTGTEGYASYVGPYANGKANAYYSDRLSASGSHTFANGLKLGFSGFAEANRSNYFPVGSVIFSADPAALSPVAYSWQKSRTHGLRVYGEFDTGRIHNTLSAQTFRISRHYVDGPAAIASDNHYIGTRHKLRYLGTAPMGAKGTLSFGAESTREGLDEYGTNGTVQGQRTINAVFTELAYSPSDSLDLTAALRRAHDSRFGGATTGRVALAWRPSSDLTLRASAGTGFRAPSSYELFSLYGNPGLQPEKSRSVDLGVERRFGEGRMIRATAFWLTADNLIGFDYGSTACGSRFGCYAQVPGTSRRSGIEIEGQTKIGVATLKGSYTYIDSSVNAANWASVPRHSVALGLSGPLSRHLKGEVRMQGAADNGTLPDYMVFSTSFTYDLGQGAEAYLRIDNLFNAKYQLVQDYATPGRSIYVGLRKSF
jgi:vitamin B12 transporter